MSDTRPADPVRPLRRRLFLAGLIAIYLPVLLVSSVALLTSDEQVSELVPDPAPGASNAQDPTGFDVGRENDSGPGTPVAWAAVALLPVSAALAWLWSGRAVRPVRNTLAIQHELIEEASHELRTPLAVLQTNAEVMLAHPDPTLDAYRVGLVRSGEEARRMAGTIEDLLVAARSRTRTVDRQAVVVDQVVWRAVDGIAPIARRRNVTLHVAGDNGLRARVDPASVERAVANLVLNAVEHSPSGERVDVGVAFKPPAATDAAPFVEITVTDRGPGIASRDQEHIFERYWRSDASTGSGIGLAIVEQVAQGHGGDVTVESPAPLPHDSTQPRGSGPGTTFRLRLTT